jgi:hypothetical protein
MTDIYIDPTIAALRDLHQQIHTNAADDDTIADYLTRQARGIRTAHQQGNRAVVFHLACWCPDFIGVDADQVMRAELSAEQAQFCVAREYGYRSWSEIEQLSDKCVNPDFEQAVDALLGGDLNALRQQLQRQPALSQMHSAFAHRATLLHYIGANGVESYRQVTPMNAADLCRCVLDAGADVNAVANVYGGSTALALVTSSAHPANAGLTDALAAVLNVAGAR